MDAVHIRDHAGAGLVSTTKAQLSVTVCNYEIYNTPSIPMNKVQTLFKICV
jgi:hypothetical protein